MEASSLYPQHAAKNSMPQEVILRIFNASRSKNFGGVCLKDDVSGGNAGQLRDMRGPVGASLGGSTGSFY
jgi:hypothetical protein